MAVEPGEPLAVSVPLYWDEHGACRVGGTRITLDVLIEDFDSGHSPEWIAHNYPTLPLGDVYAVIAWYLKHRDDVKAYLQRREREEEAINQRLEASQLPRPDMRAELMARRACPESGHATPGE